MPVPKDLSSDDPPRGSWLSPVGPRHPRNVASATYGLILAASVIAASDAASGDRAATVCLFVVFTSLATFIADLYSRLLGRWSQLHRRPTIADVREIARDLWPKVSVIAVPVVVLLLGVLDAVPDQDTINLALYICVLEMAVTAWYASRGAGATRTETVFAVGVSVAIGATIIALKAALH